jgi:hypothetical protein
MPKVYKLQAFKNMKNGTDISNYQTEVFGELLELEHGIMLVSHFCLCSWLVVHSKTTMEAHNLTLKSFRIRINVLIPISVKNNVWDNNECFSIPALESTFGIPELHIADVPYVLGILLKELQPSSPPKFQDLHESFNF